MTTLEKPKRIATLATALSALSISQTLYDKAKTKYDEKFVYSASLHSSAYVYEDFLLWLNDSMNAKSVKVMSRATGVVTLFDGTVRTKFNLDGYTIRMEIERPDVSKVQDGESVMHGDMDIMHFHCPNRAGIEALLRFLEELTEAKKMRVRQTYLWSTKSHGWSAQTFKGRDLDSVFLPEGVKESFTADIEKFFDTEEQYARLGAPYHRGYLLYGPPGNGKSSLASAVSKHYRLNLYNLPLSSVKDDRELMDRITDINEHSVLLLEDIDIFSKSMSREQSESGPTLAGLLNALDGVGTPHGLITFMTTNHIDSLDPALIRRGRVDMHIELTKPVPYQIESMFRYAYGEELGVEPAAFDSMADLSDVFKRHITEPEAARLEIKNGNS